MPEPSDREQIKDLRAEAKRREDRIEGLERAARDRNERIERLEADALLSDARIAGLVAEVEGLNQAMEHRAVIEQAKGVIMSTMGCGADAAFAVLVVQSQTQNRKLWAVAAELAGLQVRQVPPD
jgi:hypothetical protein